MDFQTRQQLRARIRAIAEPTVEDLGCELVGVELTGGAEGAILRLSIDRPGGVAVHHCAAISRALSPELDVEDPLPGHYRLEVSSPGMQRPVERPADFERFKGYRVKVRMDPNHGRRRYVGTLEDHSPDQLTVLMNGRTVALSMAEVDRVLLDLDPEQFARLGVPTPSTPGEPS